MNSLPYIERLSDGKYHLFCGVCHESIPYVQQLPISGMTLRSITCGNHCSPGGHDNQICGMSDIPELAVRDCGNGSKRAVLDVCE